MKLSTPNDIVRECNAALEFLSEGSNPNDARTRVLVLLCLLQAKLLPPHQQSLTTLADNLHNALLLLERRHHLLDGIATHISFEHSTNNEPIEPSMLRAAVSAISSIKNLDAPMLARAAEVFMSENAQSDESAFLNPLLMGLIPFAAGNTVLDVHCGSALRCVAAQRKVFEQSSHPELSRKLRVNVEEDDGLLRTSARCMAALNDLQLNIHAENFFSATAPLSTRTARPLQQFDRLFIECTHLPPDLSSVVALMADHSVCALILSDEASSRLTKREMALLLDRDVLDSVISIHSSIRPSWHVMVLRGRKSVDRRHRVLFYDHIDQYDGPSIDALSVESIVDAYEKFVGDGQHSRIMHRNDIQASRRLLPGLLNSTSLLPYQRDSYPGGLSSSQFVELDSQLVQRGIDVHSFFRSSKRNKEYKPAFNDHSLLRVAVASAPTLKNSEIRTQYAFANWWGTNAPLVVLDGTDYLELQQSFCRSLCHENVVSTKHARSLLREWWNEIEAERGIASRYGSLTLAHSWIDEFIHEATTKGHRFWFELRTTRRSLLEYMCPDLVRRFHASDKAIASISLSQSAMQLTSSQSMTEVLMRRREQNLLHDVHNARLQFEVARERISELSEFVAEQKRRMQVLHQHAKSHRTAQDRYDTHDDTLDMQDELAAIFTRLVPAQSELMMLQKSIAPYADLESRKEREHSDLDAFTQKLVPSLRQVRDGLNPQLASSLVLLQFREQLSLYVENAINRNREEIIRELESIWKRMEQSSTFSPDPMPMSYSAIQNS